MASNGKGMIRPRKQHNFPWRSAPPAQALVVFAATIIGCAAPPPAYSVKSNDPTEKIPAIRIAVTKKDQSVVPILIKDLDSDDPAVRFYANDGLRKLTGQDFGYLYYADEQTREPVVDRWKAWLAANHPADEASRGASTQNNPR